MDGDPHPLPGWAQFLRWQRSASTALTTQQSKRLTEAVKKAELVYKHWRPELRYKTTHVALDQLDEVRKAALWFLEHRRRL